MASKVHQTPAAGRLKPQPKSSVVSAQMRKMPRVGTGPELAIRRALHKSGIRYRIDEKSLPGRPDIVLTKAKIAIFVDGCFWHHCSDHGVSPKNNGEWWLAKFRQNQERDARKDEQLRNLGWLPLHVWEHTPVEDAVSLIERLWRKRTGRHQP